MFLNKMGLGQGTYTYIHVYVLHICISLYIYTHTTASYYLVYLRLHITQLYYTHAVHVYVYAYLNTHNFTPYLPLVPCHFPSYIYRYVPDAPVGQRIHVYSIPYSKNTIFTINDIYDLINIIMNTSDITVNNTMNNDIYTNNNSSNSMYTSKVSIRNEPISSQKGHNYDPYNSDPSSSQSKSNLTSDTSSSNTSSRITSSSIRLPKLMNMYASRACRSAVMIGTLG